MLAVKGNCVSHIFVQTSAKYQGSRNQLMIRTNQQSPDSLSEHQLPAGYEGRRCLREKKFLVHEFFFTVTSWQQWRFILMHTMFSSFVSSQNVSQIDVKLLCHGITFRQAQICPDLPRLSELAHSTLACDVCRQRSSGFSFKGFYSVFLLHFIPLALRLHERPCKGSSFSGCC